MQHRGERTQPPIRSEAGLQLWPPEQKLEEKCECGVQAALGHPPSLVIDGVGAEHGGVWLGEAAVHLPHRLVEVAAE